MELTKEEKEIGEFFNNGRYTFRLHHTVGMGEKVKLDEIESRWLPYIQKEVVLVSPLPYHERSILYMHIEELFSIYDRVEEEDLLDRELLGIFQTLIVALDYLSHERFLTGVFEDRHRDSINSILGDCNRSDKQHTFSKYSGRPKLNKATIQKEEDGIFCIDNREERTRVFMGLIFKKSNTAVEEFRQLGLALSGMNLKPNISNTLYDDVLLGKTDHQIHNDVVFYINIVLRTFLWLLNSTSFRRNKLESFDYFDVQYKLGIR